MRRMEVWGGSQLTAPGVELGGLDVWVYSKPYGPAQSGGGVYCASGCATGRVSHLLLADGAGRGNSVVATAATSDLFDADDAKLRGQSPG